MNERDIKKEILELLNGIDLINAKTILIKVYQELEENSVIKIKEPVKTDSKD